MSVKEYKLNINGASKTICCDEDKSLADALREAGYPGVKVGCGTGMCGACNIILDGKLVRSCVRKMKSVNDGAKILTVEGLGTEENLHPLQKAFIKFGSVQCGFCTPGFLISAYAMLQENPDPTREEVRDWFQKNRNACRCTGYKPIVDAVMAAAAVMRGDAPSESLDFVMPKDGRIYNSRYPRPAAVDKVLGRAKYGADVALDTEGCLEVAVVRPKVHHANILSIDTSEAEKAEGVVKVITAKDIKGMNRIPIPLGNARAQGSGMERPVLCDKKISYYGDSVAAVIADTREHARAAAGLVKVELEELPAYLTAIETFAEDVEPIHEGYGKVIAQMPLFYGNDVRDEFEKSKYTVEGSFFSSREPHLPIEPDTVQACIDESGTLVIRSKAQFLHFVAPMVSAATGFPKEKIRVVMNAAGGSFGYSIDPGNSALVAAACIAVDGRPVSMTLSYEEHMAMTGKRLPSYVNAKIGCDENGKLNAAQWEVLMDKGAYSIIADTYADKGVRWFGLPYYWPNAMGWSGVGMSNHAHGIAYRGAGSPQMQNASEALMDMLAEKAGIDPFEFRCINVLRDGQEGYNGYGFSTYTMPEIMEKARPYYEAARERQKTASTDTVKRGVGVCCGCFNVTSDAKDYCMISVELNENNGITVYSTWQDIGQGGDIGTLTNAHEAFRELGLRPDQITLRMNDTALPSVHGGSAGSRSHYMDGKAMKDAADKLLGAMRKEDGSFRTYEEMKAEGIDTMYQGTAMTHAITSKLDPNTGQGNPAPEHMWAAFVSEVDVDITTGKVQVVSMHAVADVGVVGNYLAVEGQAYGGMEHSIGFALSEDYSDVEKHKNLVGAGFPYIKSIPDGDNFTVDFVETERPTNPFGSGGCSEIFQSSDHVAVLNAIYDACGVRIYDIPALPEKVKAGLDLLKEGKEIPNEKYWFGEDFYDRMDDIKANPVQIPEK